MPGARPEQADLPCRLERTVLAQLHSMPKNHDMARSKEIEADRAQETWDGKVEDDRRSRTKEAPASRRPGMLRLPRAASRRRRGDRRR